MLRLAGALGSVRTIRARGAKAGAAGQARRMASAVMSRSVAAIGGPLHSAVSAARTGVTLRSRAGTNPAGTTVRTASGARGRWAAHSVWVPSQWGVSDRVLQLQLAPSSTRPLNFPLASAVLRAGG